MEPVSRTPNRADRLLTVAKMVGLGFLGIGVGIVAVLVLAFAAASSGADVSNPFLSIVLSLVAVQGVGLSIVGLAYLSVTGLGFSFIRAHVPSVRDLLWALGGFIAMVLGVVVFAIVVSYVVQQTGVQPAENGITETARDDPTVLLLLIPAAFLVIGPAEELLFRGIIQGRLRQVFSPVAAILIASTIFGFAHVTALTAGSGTLAAFLIPLLGLSVLSVVLGFAYERTDNLVVSVLIHGSYDAFLFSLLYVALASDELSAAANNSSAVLAALF